jgi:hypothetical protein
MKQPLNQNKMTPKEKAKELVSKFNFEHLGDRYILHQTVEESKRCALIAVDEILEWPQIHDLERVCEFSDEFYVKPSRYWTEVKQEIINL